MEKNVKPLKQNGPTCAIMCMLMVLNYYNKISKVNWYDERNYYRRLKSKYIEGTPLSAVALILARNNLETIILHSEKEYFSNNKNYLDNYTYDKLIEEYKMFLNNAKENGALIEKNIDINTNTIKKYIEKDYLIILPGMIGSSIHAILITGYEYNSFYACNPLFKEKQNMSKEEIEKYMTTPIGRWCVLVKNKLENQIIK